MMVWQIYFDGFYYEGIRSPVPTVPAVPAVQTPSLILPDAGRTEVGIELSVAVERLELLERLIPGAKRQSREFVMAKPQIKKSLEQFNQELAGLHMSGQWIYEDLLNRAINGPRPKGDPYLWPWKMVYEKLLEACDVLEESFTARRSLLFANPGLHDNATTHTLLMGIQMIKPGEIDWAHSNTFAAIRLV